jgi:hypothetical protein
MSSHIALIGDSAFDNSAYTNGAPDVATHLRTLLPTWRVTLCAVDGSTTLDFGSQLNEVPTTTTHAVVSIGGNDALRNADLLDLPVRSTAQALDLFEARLEDFETAYCQAVQAVLALGKHTTLCTIYNGELPGDRGRRARVALMMFNDVIVRTSLRFSVNVIELRLVCAEHADFANPIEPSGTGGLKIANAIARAIGATGNPTRRATLFAG